MNGRKGLLKYSTGISNSSLSIGGFTHDKPRCLNLLWIKPDLFPRYQRSFLSFLCDGCSLLYVFIHDLLEPSVDAESRLQCKGCRVRPSPTQPPVVTAVHGWVGAWELEDLAPLDAIYSNFYCLSFLAGDWGGGWQSGIRTSVVSPNITLWGRI